MGKITFRRVNGRVIPILNTGKVTTLIPKQLADKVADIRHLREHQKLGKTASNQTGKFLAKHDVNFIRSQGKLVGKQIAIAVKILRKK